MSKRGILLINTGSPDSPEIPEVRRYLREFLMDGRVLDIPFPLRAAIVHGLILPFRPKRSSHAYKSVWTSLGSPLVITSRSVALRLKNILGIPVEVAMRYGNPSVSSALASLALHGVDDLLVFPMFPHYAMSSYESAVMRVREVARRERPGMRLREVPPYFDHPAYLDALACTARPYTAQGFDHVLFSFHGMPVRHLAKADAAREHGTGAERERRTSYFYQSRVTVEAVANRLGLFTDQYSLSYQSRLGQDRWLEPHTDRELVRLGESGVRKLLVMCPSFTVDCLETLEEIAVRGRDTFLEAGGKEFTMIPALNDSLAWIEAMAEIVSSVEVREFGCCGTRS